MVTAAACYRFLTTWLVDAPIERSWDTLDDAERWPALGELGQVTDARGVARPPLKALSLLARAAGDAGRGYRV